MDSTNLPGNLPRPDADAPLPSRGRFIRRQRRLLIWLLAGALILLTVGLSVAATFVDYFAADLWLTHSIQRLTNPAFRALMIAVTWPGNPPRGLLMTLLAAALLALLKLRFEALYLLGCSGGGALLTNLVKLSIARPRPTAGLVEVYSVLHSNSFPSGHVVNYVSVYGLLFYFAYVLAPHSSWRAATLCFCGGMVALVGLSRVYLGAHWASDVIGGYCFGLIWLLLVIAHYARFRARRLAQSAGAGSLGAPQGQV